jgi:NAD(P)-dependent dehydrogenase (short-subunit alcohol dehydrogenase family)
MSKPLAPIAVDLAGKRAVVTGATAGIGKEAAFGLAKLGANVTLVGRSEAKVAAVIDELAQRGVPRDRMAVGVADLSRLAAVRRLADELAAKHDRIDVLLNNAGCYPNDRVITEEGFEESWATNVLAYEVLTTRLQSAVVAAKGRIVLVASTRAGGLFEDDLDWSRRRWNGVSAYEQSKMANRMLGWAWAERLAGTGATINVAHPGGVATNIAHRQTGLWGLVARLAFMTQRTPTMGADTLVWLAASPEVEGKSGGFYKDRREIRCAYKGDVARYQALWQRCQEQIAAR